MPTVRRISPAVKYETQDQDLGQDPGSIPCRRVGFNWGWELGIYASLYFGIYEAYSYVCYLKFEIMV